jgi:glycosyltransferase involved in cell wall biosynthesis
MKRIKIFRLTTIPLTLNLLLKHQLRYLNNIFDVTAISSPGEDLKEVETREGVRVIPIKIERNIKLKSDFISFLKLLKLFHKERPNIIHSNTPKSSLLSLMAGRLLSIKKLVYTVGGLRFEGSKGINKSFLIFFEKLTCKLSTHILCESIGVRNKLSDIGVEKSKLILLAPSNLNGVDTFYFNPVNFNKHELRLKLGYQETDFIFIFVGRIVRDKGIFELIDAFKLISQNINNSKLIIIGPKDSNNNDFTRFNALIKNAENITHINFIKDIREYLVISNCMVLPSYREGFPNVILESGSMGIPVIMTNVNGHDEYLNSTNGILIKIGDAEDLLNKMEEMYNNYKKFNEVEIRRQVIDKFSCEKVHNTIEKFYKSLITNA